MNMPAPLRRIDHNSEHGRWTLLRRAPPACLAGYVREMEGYVEEGGRPIVRREVPTGLVPLIINLGPGFALHDRHNPSSSRPLQSSFVAGLHDHHALVGSAGAAYCLQVNLTPLGARRFLGTPMHELTGQVVDLDCFLGLAAERLADRLLSAPTWEARFAILDAVLADRIGRSRPDIPLIAAAWLAIEISAGSIGIGVLARRLDCSRKHLNQLFRREIGLAPKMAARVLRFRRAFTTLTAGRARTLADLAAACGYYDQAHFNRDFQIFAGESPTALLARALPDGTGIIEGMRRR